MDNIDLKGRDFLKLLDYTPQEINYLLDLSAALKAMKKAGQSTAWFTGRNVALIFEKTSTRTRCAFEVAAHDLGMGSTYLDPTGSQIGRKESVADTARVLAGMYEGIEYRGFGQKIVEELAQYADVPVWNGLTNEFHPTQMLADMLTIRECFGSEKGAHVTFYGDCRYNTANSLMVAGAKTGMHITLCAHPEYFPGEELTAQCRAIAEESGGSITFQTDPMKAAVGADVIYTDVWVSMGEPDEVWAKRIEDLAPYRVTRQIMDTAGEKAVFMHCLPAFHDKNTGIGREICGKFGLTEMEVTDEVFESSRSVVFREAENRMHTIKAVMAATLGIPDGAVR
jgi:ornithine carbamoyltransferase